MSQEKRTIIGFTCTLKLEHICHPLPSTRGRGATPVNLYVPPNKSLASRLAAAGTDEFMRHHVEEDKLINQSAGIEPATFETVSVKLVLNLNGFPFIITAMNK